ncbi:MULTISPECIES: DMT family transporter [unclassified Sphingomonas]|jgi:transporter family-2 protein|uniref:DMT family transporter n=1 Tax=unclassified Sphingomonas TaxID=196159 RepID=UPI000830183A|nr:MULTISPECIES: DMT family transporter [unclassified Sphingomonas]MCH4893001.1 EamA-like transporter family protein [Sphingomonas sp. SFZ2018-12]
MQLLLPILMTLIAGIGIAIQPPTNAVLARASGSVLLAALISFAVGTAILLVVWAFSDRGSIAGLRQVPWWSWLGGLYGAVFVSAAAYAAPRLGLATMLTLAIGTQLTAALVIDQFGLLGLARSPVTPVRLAGLVLLLAGVALMLRRG